MSHAFDGAALRRIRARRGVTQKELAEAIGRQKTMVSHYETGKREPSIAALGAMAYALDVTTDALIRRVEVAA